MATGFGNRVLPCLLVSNMRKSLEFYLEVLGFTQTGYYPIASDPVRTEVRRDDVAIVLISESARGISDKPGFSGAFYIFPDSIDNLATALRDQVPFAWGPEDTDFGIREFAIRDPDGYTLVFAERALS